MPAVVIGTNELPLSSAGARWRWLEWGRALLPSQVARKHKGKQGDQNENPRDVEKPIVMQVISHRAR
jgi:hypothetical protein